MRKGKRYYDEPKLNIKKVIIVLLIIILIVMFVMAMKNLLKSDSSANNLVSTSYFVINENNKWGVIDNNAQIIIDPTYDSTIIIPNNKKPVFICTYDEDYEKGIYKTKVLNNKNKQIFTNFDKVLPLENYDENYNMWYEANVMLVEQNEKYGLIDLDGKIILDVNYDKIYTLKGIENSLITVKDNKIGLVNNSGKEIIENKYEEVKALGENSKKYIVKENGKYGVYGVLDCKYQEIKQLNNDEIYCVKENGKYKVINNKEEIVFSEKFDNIETIKDNIIVYKYKDAYCAYNVELKEKLNKTYKTLKYTDNNLFIARTSNNYGIIDMKNEAKIKQEYANINYYEDTQVYELEQKNKEVNKILNSNLEEIAEGIVSESNEKGLYIKVWQKDGYKYYTSVGEEKTSQDILKQNNLFLSKQNNKYGFVNKEGEVVVDYIYDDAREQNEFGYVSVKKDGLWGSLDKEGNIISETTHNLENNLLIDFIGKYHIGVDINSKYYTSK